MPLADVIGQDAAVATLKSALVRDAVPQSYLFVGPEGVGKATAAVELAWAILCLRPDVVPGDACGGV